MNLPASQGVKQALEDLVKEGELCREKAYQCGHCQKMKTSKTMTGQAASEFLLMVLNLFSEFTGDNKDRDVREVS